MKTTISSEFRIRGKNFNPSNLFKEIGLKPTRVWREGDLVQSSPTLRRKDTAWILSTEEVPSLSIEDQLQKLLDLILPYSNAVMEVCLSMNLDAEFSFGVYMAGSQTPSIYLTKEMIHKVGKFNARIDIDLICT